MDVVYILWEDTCSSPGWNDEHTLHKLDASPVLVNSVGFLLSKQRTHVIIAPTLAPIKGGLGDIMRIPLGMIKEMRVLETFSKETIYDASGE